MIINHNIAALNTHRQLGNNNNATQNSLEKLSSGLKINKAGDDAAGLAISEKMRGQIKGLEMASKNAQDGISLVQTAEGALNETHAILQRMRELAVQSSNDTNTETDRGELQKEVDQLSQEVTRIADTTEFNTQNLLGKDGGAGFSGKFHIGANSSQNITLDIANMSADSLKVAGKEQAAVASTGTIQGINVSAENGTSYSIEIVQASGTSAVTAATAEIEGNTIKVTLGTGDTSDTPATSTLTEVATLIDSVSGVTASVDSGATAGDAAVVGTGVALSGGSAALTAAEAAKSKGIDISSQASADAAMTTIQSAIDTVSAERSKLGAVQNRLDHTINNLGTSSENLTAAESRIRDVDMAKEMMEFTKNNILSQAAQAMLAQSNQMPQGVLQLLR